MRGREIIKVPCVPPRGAEIPAWVTFCPAVAFNLNMNCGSCVKERRFISERGWRNLLRRHRTK